MLNKWTQQVKGIRHFDIAASKGKLDVATDREKEEILAAMPGYGGTLAGDVRYSEERFKVKDIVHRVDAGTGSLGIPRYYLLIEGKSTSQNDDRILDVKRQGKPSPYAYLTEAD